MDLANLPNKLHSLSEPHSLCQSDDAGQAGHLPSIPSMARECAASRERRAGEDGLQVVSAAGGQTGPARASQSALTHFASRTMQVKRDTFRACDTCIESLCREFRLCSLCAVRLDTCNHHVTIYSVRGTLFALLGAA